MSIPALYEVPLEEFTAARNALARKLKDEGNGEESKRVAGLRKPSKALWLINQFARRAPADLKALIEATQRVRNAQEKGLAGDEVREAMRAQRAALASLTALAEPSLQRRVHDTLQAAALADPAALREGRLEQELEPAGFEALLASGVTALQPSAPVLVAKKPVVKDKAADKKLLAAAEAKKLAVHAASLEAKAAKARAEATSASAAEAKARQLADEAEAAAAKAHQAVEKARQAAAKAEAAASTAAEEARKARAAAEAAEALAT